MKLYVVRHGQTAWNAARLLQGSTDIPLNETGLRQARETADLLRDVPIDRIFLSPLSRAAETGRIIAEGRDIPVKEDERLRERGYGEFEGKTKEKDSYARLWAYTKNFRFESAENVRACFARIYSFLDEIREKHPDETVLIATHAGVAKVVHCYFCGMESDDWLANYVPANAAPQLYEL